MIKLFIKLFKGAKQPVRAYATPAGTDIFAFSEPRIVGKYIERFDGVKLWENIEFIEYDTGLAIQPEDPNYHTLIFPRSSLSKYYLSLKNSAGIIDSDYNSNILLRFSYIFQPTDLVVLSEAGAQKVYGIVDNEKIYHKGDAIGQMVFSKTIVPEMVVVDDLKKTDRGEKGFGSSTKSST